MKIVIYAKPMPKERARVVLKGGKVRSYTPKKTEHLTNLIRDKIVDLNHKFDKGVPLAVTIRYWVPRPKSAKKSRVYPAVRPDLDNYNKLVLDSLQGFAYDDDGQIVSLYTQKRYTTGVPRVPKIVIEIEEEKEVRQ